MLVPSQRPWPPAPGEVFPDLPSAKAPRDTQLLRYCARPPFALERLSMIRDADGRIAHIRYVLPRHKAANWVRPGRSRKSTQQGASGGVELSPFEFRDRSARAPETEARGSRAAHRSGDACGSANDRTILLQIVRAAFLTQVHGGARLPTSRRRLNRTVLVANLCYETDGSVRRQRARGCPCPERRASTSPGPIPAV